jgi:hypothetical protein
MCFAPLLLERILPPLLLPINRLVEHSKLRTTMYDCYSLIFSGTSISTLLDVVTGPAIQSLERITPNCRLFKFDPL